MKKLLFLLLATFMLLRSYAQFSLSENRHNLMKDGKPFFWLGDTAWELFHRLNREEADAYLKRRAEQGFTVIQAVVLAEQDGLHTPNAYGEKPLINDDPLKPNEAYFKQVDYIIDKAAEVGLNIGLLPTWGDKIDKNTWGIGPEIFNVQNAEAYGRWIGNRYKDRKNIIWILGGDRNPRNDNDVAIWSAMGKGIMEATGGKAIIGFHPQPCDLGSATWFEKDSWLSINMFQNGHCRDTEGYKRINKVYNLQPVRPVLDAEPIYEDHPVCFNVKDLGTSSAYDVRKFAYLEIFAGACGHTYGCHDIWQFYSPEHEGINGPHYYWQQAMELPGANQMKFVRLLMESRPMRDRIPEQDLVLENNNCPSERIQATRGKDYAFIYTAEGKSFTVVMGKITGTELHAFWYDPRNGKSTEIGLVNNSGTKKFDPPSAGYGRDWVLVLDDAGKKYLYPVH